MKKFTGRVTAIAAVTALRSLFFDNRICVWGNGCKQFNFQIRYG